MKCPNCGENLPNNAVFCGNCGKKIEADIVKKIEPKKEPSADNQNLTCILDETIRLLNKALTLVPEVGMDVESSALKEENRKLNEKVKAYETQLQALRASNEMLKNKVTDMEKKLVSDRCPKCGNKLTEEMAFCNICGSKVKK